jgi:hypothetical protein
MLCGHHSALTFASKCRLFKGDTDDMPLGDTINFIRKFEIGVVGTEDLHTMFANANTRGDFAASRLTSSNQIK